jgi:hypothetical protein
MLAEKLLNGLDENGHSRTSPLIISRSKRLNADIAIPDTDGVCGEEI